MEEAKDSEVYLGVYVAEKVLSKIFKNVTRMPRCHSGYDFICGKGFKIDVKSACTKMIQKKYPAWYYNIKHNKDADYFFLMAFDNRESLTPIHLWLVPGGAVNDKDGFYIHNNQKSLSKWSEYERPIDDVQMCCDAMKSKAES